MTIDQLPTGGALIEEELVASLRASFGGRPAVSLAELAKLLKLDEKTLLRHIRAGRLPFRAVGNGRRRVTRRFTIADVVQFFGNQRNRYGIAASTTPKTAWRPSPGGGFAASVQRPGRSGLNSRLGRRAAGGGKEA